MKLSKVEAWRVPEMLTEMTNHYQEPNSNILNNLRYIYFDVTLGKLKNYRGFVHFNQSSKQWVEPAYMIKR